MVKGNFAELEGSTREEMEVGQRAINSKKKSGVLLYSFFLAESPQDDKKRPVNSQRRRVFIMTV